MNGIRANYMASQHFSVCQKMTANYGEKSSENSLCLCHARVTFAHVERLDASLVQNHRPFAFAQLIDSVVRRESGAGKRDVLFLIFSIGITW